MASSVMNNLANLLPTGTYLGFQTLAPLFTNNGVCGTTEKVMTGLLLLVFVTICGVLSFTDSVTTDSGKVFYGVVTCKGLFNPQFASCTAKIQGLNGYFYTGGSDPNKYIFNTFDLITSLLVVITFASLSMLTPPITTCFYPEIPSTIAKCAPILVALIVGMYFAFAPPARNGVGFAVVAGKTEIVKELEHSVRPENETMSRLLGTGNSKSNSSNSSPSAANQSSSSCLRADK